MAGDRTSTPPAQDQAVPKRMEREAMPFGYIWRTRRHDNGNDWQFQKDFSPALMEKVIEFEPVYLSAPQEQAPCPKCRSKDTWWSFWIVVTYHCHKCKHHWGASECR